MNCQAERLFGRWQPRDKFLEFISVYTEICWFSGPKSLETGRFGFEIRSSRGMARVKQSKTAEKGKTAEKQSKSGEKDGKPPLKTIADNRRARHEFEVLETIETGIELAGTEVKSMRQGKANLQDSHARIEDGEVWLYNCHISPYDHGNRFNHDPVRKRRLLLNKREILKLKSKIQEKGLTLIPLKLYFKANWVKVNLGLCRGKRLYDKRQTITKRDADRQIERLVKSRRY